MAAFPWYPVQILGRGESSGPWKLCHRAGILSARKISLIAVFCSMPQRHRCRLDLERWDQGGPDLSISPVFATCPRQILHLLLLILGFCVLRWWGCDRAALAAYEWASGNERHVWLNDSGSAGLIQNLSRCNDPGVPLNQVQVLRALIIISFAKEICTVEWSEQRSRKQCCTNPY